MSKEYEHDSKKRLTKIMVRKQRTIMIGAVSLLEDIFGFLWDQDSEKPYSDEIEDLISTLDEKMAELGLEKDFEKLWYFIRNKLLNQGNDQIRATETELENYTVNWDRYTYNMPVKGRKSND